MTTTSQTDTGQMPRACSCLEQATLHDGHCCLRHAYDHDTNTVTCGHQPDWQTLRDQVAARRQGVAS